MTTVISKLVVKYHLLYYNIVLFIGLIDGYTSVAPHDQVHTTLSMKIWEFIQLLEIVNV